MSRRKEANRLLKRALTDAMNRDLANIPKESALEGMHTFSAATDQRIRGLDAAPHQRSDARSARMRRYAGLAAALVCVVGLAAVLRINGGAQMGTSVDGAAESKDAAADDCADASGAPEMNEEAADSVSGAYEESETADSASDDSVLQESAEPSAPDWQEQLFIESAKADQTAQWRLRQSYEDGTFTTDTVVLQMPSQGRLRISDVYEVYYEQQPDDWIRVYHASERTYSLFSAEGDEQGDCYDMQELNMTQAGSYRLVRQVNGVRQVLALQTTWSVR